jgi:histone H3
VLFWYFLISLSATVPGLNRWGFFTPPVAGADFRAAFVASCLRGALPPVDFLAVCFVRAIEMTEFGEMGLRGFFIVSREK